MKSTHTHAIDENTGRPMAKGKMDGGKTSCWWLMLPAVFAFTGCFSHTVERETIVREPAETIIIREAPPAPLVEVRSRAPGREYVWIEGYWTRKGANWKWHSGHWEAAPQRDAVWVPGYWEEKRDSWRWVEGHWESR